MSSLSFAGHSPLQRCARFASQRMMPATCSERVFTVCTASPPRAPFFTSVMESIGNAAASSSSSNSSSTSPCRLLRALLELALHLGDARHRIVEASSAGRPRAAWHARLPWRASSPRSAAATRPPAAARRARAAAAASRAPPAALRSASSLAWKVAICPACAVSRSCSSVSRWAARSAARRCSSCRASACSCASAPWLAASIASSDFFAKPSSRLNSCSQFGQVTRVAGSSSSASRPGSVIVDTSNHSLSPAGTPRCPPV